MGESAKKSGEVKTKYQVAKNFRLYEIYDKTVTARLEEKLKDNPVEPIFTDNAVSILSKRYLRKDSSGEPQEDVKGMLRRVAANVAYPDFHFEGEKAAYESASTFYEMMAKRDFMPNSPALMNAGREMQQLAACFVLPIEDHMKSIFEGVYNTAMIHKSGGGTGFSFGNIRRKNDFVESTYGKASGPVSFIGAYDAATHSVNQGGFRRGANMGSMPVTHPDIMEFASAKQNEKARRFEAFNFSIGITKKFMTALRTGENIVAINPRDGETYELTSEDLKRDESSVREKLIGEKERVLVVDEDGNVIYQNPLKRDLRGKITEVEKMKIGKIDDQGRVTFDPQILFDEFAKLAWNNGEPGILFFDRMNESNPTHPRYFKGKGEPPIGVGVIEATNPCGEQPLLPYEACDLGHINLGNMVTESREINWEKLETIVKNAVRFLDNVVDMSNYPLEKIEETVHSNRKIGLGIMGWADMLTKLRVPYNSDQALHTAEEVMKFIREKGIEQSEELAKTRGAFPNFKHSMYSKEKPRRNATVTTIAPTGTTSIIAGASGGIEPNFDHIYIHKDSDGQERKFINESLLAALKEENIDEEKVLQELEAGKKLIDLDFVPDSIKKVFVTSDDIPVEYHVKTQAAFQKYTDNAVSKTINLPNSASVDDIKKAFILAYEQGCKGITVYRKGSREIEVMESRKGDLETIAHYVKAKKRPEKLSGDTIRKRTGCGNLFVTINYEETNGGDRDLFEIFAQMGKGGGCGSSQNEATGRLASFLLRAHVDPKEVASQLIGIRCNKPYNLLGKDGTLSCADAIGKALAETLEFKVETDIGDSENFENLLDPESKAEIKAHRERSERLKQLTNDVTGVGGGCPDCGSVLEPAEGCMGGKCTNMSCGYSECS